MTDESVSQNFLMNVPLLAKQGAVDDITISKGQKPKINEPPKSLLDWLVRVHVRLMALECEDPRNKE